VPAPAAQELHAPGGWRRLDFISDLHLQPGEPQTAAAWRRYMAATPADALFILGDLFEAWIGDDDAREPGFAAECAAVLGAAATRLPIFFLHGNRDFLLGEAFAGATGITLLADPTVLDFGGARWLLTHGDALCLDDVDYLRFRAQVRQESWQQAFLAQPLAERRAVARAMRGESEQRKRSGAVYADVDARAAAEWLQAAGADTLIHGHTHRPAEHPLDGGRRRIVLSDWDAAAQPPRLEVLRLEAGAPPRRLALA
jgi:UDP-2,3-diacylglucosamine hydrolase